MWFFYEYSGDHRYLHVLTHAFPTRRSSDLGPAGAEIDARCGDHLFGNRDDLAFGQRFGVGREAGAQSFALREVEDGKALEEGDAAGILAAFARAFLRGPGGEAVGIDQGHAMTFGSASWRGRVCKALE